MKELSQEQMEELRELFNHPSFQLYLDVIEESMFDLFKMIFFLDPSKAESFIKFVEFKGRIDQMRDVTYGYARELTVNPNEVQDVDKRYSERFKGLLMKLIGR